MAQNKALAKVRAGLVGSYHLDTLGAPFKVILKDCVTQSIDPLTGEETVNFPDPVGLVLAVIRCRVLDPRRLSGDDLSFIRKALGVKSGKIAVFLDMTPEHYSRCETGIRALSAASEKQFRLFAFSASLFNDADGLLDSIEQQPEELPVPANEKSRKLADQFLKVFLSMKIAPSVRVVGSEERPIEYVFYRRSARCNDPSGDVPCDDGDWLKLKAS